MDISNIIALFALLLSGAAFWLTYAGQKSQERLTNREVELVRRQLNQFETEERAAKEANVSAKLYKVGKVN